MTACPHCGEQLLVQSVFCPHCGTQLRVQSVHGDVLEPGASRPRRPIDPGKAARLSLIPGLGHWYAGSPARGLAFFAGVLAPLVVGTELDLRLVGAIIGVPLDLGGLALWAYCAFDAYRIAKRRIDHAT